MSEIADHRDDLLSPKLRKLQIKLVEKRYGAVAAMWIATMIRGELSSTDLRRLEPALKLLAQYLTITEYCSSKLEDWRQWSLGSKDGHFLIEILIVLNIIAQICLFNVICSHIFDGWLSVALPSALWLSLIIFVRFMFRGTLLVEFYICLLLICPAVVIFR